MSIASALKGICNCKTVDMSRFMCVNLDIDLNLNLRLYEYKTTIREEINSLTLLLIVIT